MHSSIRGIQNLHGDALVNENLRVVGEKNAFLKFTSTGGSVSLARRRISYTSKEFSVVMPTEFVLKKDSCICSYFQNVAGI